ncbi:MAG: sn-glycerol-3-phosphate ABC transporter ATP-binding protein UgpC [Rhodobacteraceae bacterium]|nr:sn-glycerol-3-phosphate ABC transporter ATP-binding protein UgpC [Paracoccaceae bacterium]
MSDLTLSSIRKSYGAVAVINGLDLTISQGEFVALVGPSGSGKSTLLRIIAGLEDIDSGTITLGGRDITRADPSDRDMAMVFQSYALYPHMSVADNMTFALRMRKAPADEVQRRLKSALEILHLTGYEDRKPGQLSGGQRQRVAMGRAIVREPAVFLFDEPLSNLDAKLRAKTRTELRQLHERLKATSVFVTHDQIEAMTMADRIVLLDEGIVQQIGTPHEIYNNPINRFVASFIGSPEINMLKGTLGWDGNTLKLDDITLPVSPERLAALEEAKVDGQKVELGVRAEHLGIAAPDERSNFSMTISVVEFTGHDAFVSGERAGAQIVLRIDPTIQEALGSDLAAGKELPLKLLSQDAWHLFDADSGLCLTHS